MVLEWEGVERSHLRTQPNAAKRTRKATAGLARRQVQVPVQAQSATSVGVGHRFLSRDTPRLARKGHRIKPVVAGGVDGEVCLGSSEFVSWSTESATDSNGVSALRGKELLEVGGDVSLPRDRICIH